jgi:hypothetical protein
MATIFAQMGRNTVSAGLCGQFGSPDRIGMRPTPCVTDRGNVIDIHTQS